MSVPEFNLSNPISSKLFQKNIIPKVADEDVRPNLVIGGEQPSKAEPPKDGKVIDIETVNGGVIIGGHFYSFENGPLLDKIPFIKKTYDREKIIPKNPILSLDNQPPVTVDNLNTLWQNVLEGTEPIDLPKGSSTYSAYFEALGRATPEVLEAHTQAAEATAKTKRDLTFNNKPLGRNYFNEKFDLQEDIIPFPIKDYPKEIIIKQLSRDRYPYLNKPLKDKDFELTSLLLSPRVKHPGFLTFPEYLDRVLETPRLLNKVGTPEQLADTPTVIDDSDETSRTVSAVFDKDTEQFTLVDFGTPKPLLKREWQTKLPVPRPAPDKVIDVSALSNDALLTLAQSGDPKDRIAVAQYEKTPRNILASLAQDRELEVRQAAMGNKNTPLF